MSTALEQLEHLKQETQGIRAQVERDLVDAMAMLQRHAESMAQIQAAIETAESREPLHAQVPYRSQWEGDALHFVSDCGPACVAMIVQYVTKEHVPIDVLAAECGMTETRNTFPQDLILGAATHGVKLACLIIFSVVSLKVPGIVLVHYEALPRLDMRYTRGHWVVVTHVANDQVWYHDPDWWGTRMNEGENRCVRVEQFDQAMQACTLDGNPAGLVLVIP